MFFASSNDIEIQITIIESFNTVSIIGAINKEFFESSFH